MKNEQQTIEVEVPAGLLVDYPTFIELRKGVYEQGRDPEDMKALAESVTLKNGGSLMSAALEASSKALGPDDPANVDLEKNQALSRRLEIAQRAKESGEFITLIFKDVVDPQNLLDVRHGESIERDEAAIKQQQRMADQVGYGPKNNYSSGVISVHRSKRSRKNKQ